MIASRSRRDFLRAAPLAAAAGLVLADERAFAATGAIGLPIPFQYFTAQALADDAKTLQATPGNNNLVGTPSLPFAIVMTTETAKSAKEFEWHEGRDHIVQIIDGTTVYEVGGTPQNGRSTKPGEWLAPASAGAARLILKKGDMLTIPRGTPHKRSTETSVTLYLISPSGVMVG